MKTVFKSFLTLIILAGIGQFGPTAKAAIQTEDIICESNGFQLQECQVSGTIVGLSVKEKFSHTLCVGEERYPVAAPDPSTEQFSYFGKFGFYDNVLWVSMGCRANFTVQYEDAVIVPPVVPLPPPSGQYCAVMAEDGLVQMFLQHEDQLGQSHIRVQAPQAYTWVMLMNHDFRAYDPFVLLDPGFTGWYYQVVADPYDISCDEGGCGWTFIVPNFQTGFVSFFIDAVNNQWPQGQVLATCPLFR